MKVVALDIGDRWTGVAISDALMMLARPYDTADSEQLIPFLKKLFQSERVSTVLVGYPKTLRGTESEQTKKVVSTKEQLEKEFPHIDWKLWDERLTSQQAAKIKQAKTKEEKLKSHAIAAALILESYLQYRHFNDQE